MPATLLWRVTVIVWPITFLLTKWVFERGGTPGKKEKAMKKMLDPSKPLFSRYSTYFVLFVLLNGMVSYSGLSLPWKVLDRTAWDIGDLPDRDKEQDRW